MRERNTQAVEVASDSTRPGLHGRRARCEPPTSETTWSNQLPPSFSLFERERRADRFVELLECLADLRVATARQEIEIIDSIGEIGRAHV